MASVELVSASKPYGATRAVDDISLKVPDGSYCCLLGPSGCGKTSTLRLIMFAVFNRFDKCFEEATRDLGASPYQTARHVVLPVILPSLVGVALLGFTLSYDERARSSQALDAQGTLTTALSLVVIGASLTALWWLRARQASRGSDAGKDLV